MEMKRLYWSDVLASTRLRYKGAWHCQLVREMRLHNYEAETLEELYKKIKADGWQVWGHKDHLDYYRPHNALEYLILRDVLLAQGMSEDEIEKDYLPND